MNRILLLALAVLTLSCNKISQEDVQGKWFVESIFVQEITAHSDSGWKSQDSVSAVFHTGEELTIRQRVIIPCPSASAMLEHYDQYDGTIKYTLSDDKLIIPDIHFYQAKVQDDGLTSEASETTVYGVTLDIRIDGGTMTLSGTKDQTDNLGNVEKRTNIRISLTRSN